MKIYVHFEHQQHDALSYTHIYNVPHSDASAIDIEHVKSEFVRHYNARTEDQQQQQEEVEMGELNRNSCIPSSGTIRLVNEV